MFLHERLWKADNGPEHGQLVDDAFKQWETTIRTAQEMKNASKMRMETNQVLDVIYIYILTVEI